MQPFSWGKPWVFHIVEYVYPVPQQCSWGQVTRYFYHPLSGSILQRVLPQFSPHCNGERTVTHLSWLVVWTLWKIWFRQLGWWHSQYMGKMFQTTNQCMVQCLPNHGGSRGYPVKHPLKRIELKNHLKSRIFTAPFWWVSHLTNSFGTQPVYGWFNTVIWYRMVTPVISWFITL